MGGGWVFFWGGGGEGGGVVILISWKFGLDTVTIFVKKTHILVPSLPKVC